MVNSLRVNVILEKRGHRQCVVPMWPTPANLSIMKRTTVLLAEDHTIVRQGLRLLIEADGDIEIVGEAKTGREAVQMTSELCPQIVVMDIAMPLLNGIQATRQILKAFPATKILILSAHSDPEYVEQVIKAGALGYLVKQSSGEVVAKAIRELQKGKSFFTASIAKHLKNGYQKSVDGVGLRKKSDIELTSREAELLQMIAEGHVNKQIASELGISIKTVEKHRQHLMEKLNIHDIAGLTRFAIAAGIIESSVQSTIAQDAASNRTGSHGKSRVKKPRA
jgi:DNA-binding NarL/FixJ family response regulator